MMRKWFRKLIVKRTCRKYGQFEAHRIVLEGAHEEYAMEENRPYCHVSKDPSSQVLSPNHRSAVRQDSDKVPRKRTCDDRYVNEGQGSEMPEVERREIE